MTDHQKIRDDLALYATGDLDPARTAAVEAHVATCAECARAVDELRVTVDDVRSAVHPIDRVPDALASLDVPRSKPLADVRRARWLRAAALLLAFGLGVVADRVWAGRQPRPASTEPVRPAAAVPEPRLRAYAAASRARSGFSRGLAALAELSPRD